MVGTEQHRRNDVLLPTTHESSGVPLPLSPVVLQLLQGEDVFVEIFLEFLIGIVNVKLLKTIHLQEEKIIKFYILVPML